MFAFDLFIGVLARSFNLFSENFPGGLTGQKAPAADARLSVAPEKSLAPLACCAPPGNVEHQLDERLPTTRKSLPCTKSYSAMAFVILFWNHTDITVA
ncbi:hypothetical protein [Pseudomonas sp. FME51]|uniref:hypothetical protein n=1 Tax=Pseudomonas sp. FME51 TaxID=2742609 RepID=UPI001866FCF7|nr:hypothetical protein [Pseudomonas sp. FME51]